MIFGIGKKNPPAFMYCVADGQLHTILLDHQKMTIGCSKNVDICLPQPWIGKTLGIISKSHNGQYYFEKRSSASAFIWVNRRPVPETGTQTLSDRDVILISNPASQEWLLLWFRQNISEIGSAWKNMPVCRIHQILPIVWEDGVYYLCGGSSGNKALFVDKHPVTGRVRVSPGMTVQADEVSGVFTSESFFYQDSEPGINLHSGTAAQNAGGYIASTSMAHAHAVDHSIDDPAAPVCDGKLSIDIEERTVHKFPRKKVLLRDIHIDIYNRQMVLLLGESGAGKTTLLNAIIGYEKARGRISYNGIPLDELRKSDNAIGYVPQTDILRPGDTVGNTIRNAAEMKLPEDILNDKTALQQRIHHTLKLMGLSEKEREQVSKLSGGEKKRLSVAVEYIGNPKLFFLDEPDSGLDGAQARNLMNILREIADEGRIVVIISHSPDRAFSYFDRVIVLLKSRQKQCGELGFYGTVERATAFFGVNDLEGVIGALKDTKNNADHSDIFISRYQNLNPGRGGLQ